MGKMPEIKKENRAPKTLMMESKLGINMARYTISKEVKIIPTLLTNDLLHSAFANHSSNRWLFWSSICQLRSTGFNVRPYFAIGLSAINHTASRFKVWLYSGIVTKFCVIYIEFMLCLLLLDYYVILFVLPLASY